MGRSPSKISQEVKRNYSKKKDRYHPWRATVLYITRRKNCKRKYESTQTLIIPDGDTKTLNEVLDFLNENARVIQNAERRERYSDRPEVITLSAEATEYLTAFAEGIEPKMKYEYAEIADWTGKLIGNTLRIAGILCRASTYRMTDFLYENDPLVFSGETMENAIRFGRYYLSHALAVFDAIPEESMHKHANRILNMIREKNLTEFNRRTAMHYCQSFKRVDEIQPVLDFLDDYGYIIRMPYKSVASRRPPLPRYTVNLSVLS